jgi:LPS-assembly lipoprotein
MSLADGMPSSRFGIARAARIAALLCAAVALQGCIRPLYAPTTLSTQGGSVRQALAAIEVPMIPDRLGHTLRNELVFLLEGRDVASAPKRYRLLIAVNESVLTTIVNSTFQRADQASVQASANYRLVSASDMKEVASGSVSGFATYERTPQRFANLRAARDAQQRVARYLAEQIHLQLATKLTSPAS